MWPWKKRPEAPIRREDIIPDNLTQLSKKDWELLRRKSDNDDLAAINHKRSISVRCLVCRKSLRITQRNGWIVAFPGAPECSHIRGQCRCGEVTALFWRRNFVSAMTMGFPAEVRDEPPSKWVQRLRRIGLQDAGAEMPSPELYWEVLGYALRQPHWHPLIAMRY